MVSKTALYVGIATRQSNPTVEIECRELLEPSLVPLVTRLTSRAKSPEARLLEYFRTMKSAIDSFGTLPLAVFGFACTASSYLVGADVEERATRELRDITGITIVTAAQAIRRELELLGVRNLAVLAPYSETICDAALNYWRKAGFGVPAVYRMHQSDEKLPVHDISIPQVRSNIRALDTGGVDALLLSSTGMPTLELVADSDLAVPIVSSNYCLALELLRRAGASPAEKPGNPGTLRDPRP